MVDSHTEKRGRPSAADSRWTDPIFVDESKLPPENRARLRRWRRAWQQYHHTGDKQPLREAGLIPPASDEECPEDEEPKEGSGVKLTKIKYAELSSKQKEVFNFQKVASALADYGFNCIKLADDWQGADFLAYHKDGEQTLKVQLKARVTIDRKYLGKDLYMTFPHKGVWYLIHHDELVRIAGETTSWLRSASWKEHGGYSSAGPSQEMLEGLSAFALGIAERG